MNGLYKSAKQKFLEGGIAYLSDTIKAVLVDTDDYTYSATHTALSDIPAPARVATATLSAKTSTDGVADAADATFPGATGDKSEAVVLYKDSGSAATSWLIAYIDTAVGLPVTLNGDDVLVIWPTPGIFEV